MEPPKHRKRRRPRRVDGASFHLDDEDVDQTPVVSLDGVSDRTIDALEDAGVVYVDDLPEIDCDVLRTKVDPLRFHNLKSLAEQHGVEFPCCPIEAAKQNILEKDGVKSKPTEQGLLVLSQAA